MAPSLRKSLRQKTKASAKTAEKVGYTRRPRAPPSRKQRYTRNKGLVSMKPPKALQNISIANSTNSPLLQLPAETRTMIFKYAVRPTYGWIGLYFNRQNLISRSHSSVQGHKSELKDIAVHLPVVCRQVYAETVTLIYSHNCFAFQSESSMKLWLDKRLLAQREAIRWMMLPCFVYEHRVYDGNDWEWKYETEDVADRMRKICPNLIEMEEDDWLDECIYLRDYQDRGADPSSGDENPYERE